MDAVGSVASIPINSSAFPAASANQAQNNSVVQHATQVTCSQGETADITITTAEGDKVTLSSNQMAEISFATYNAQGQANNQTSSLTAQSAQVSHSSGFSLTVDGNLSPEELKQIRSAIHTIEKAAKDALAGHPDEAAAQTAKLAGLDQIASINADIEFTQDISVTQASDQTSAATASTTNAQVPAPTPPPATVPQPVAVPVTPQESPATTVAVPPQQPAVTQAAPAMTTPTANARNLLIPRGTTGAPSHSQHQGARWLPEGNIWNVQQSGNVPRRADGQSLNQPTGTTVQPKD